MSQAHHVNDVALRQSILRAATEAPESYRGINMTVCPVAIMAGCKKCPAVSICPLKSVLGDYVEEDSGEQKPQSGPMNSDQAKD